MADDLVPIDKDKVKTQGADLLTFATSIMVVDESSWYEAREKRQLLDELDKTAEKWFKKLKQPSTIAHRAITDAEKEIRDPLEAAFEALEPKILDFEKDYFEVQRPRLQRQMQEQAAQRAQEERDAEVEGLVKAGNQKAADELRAQPLYVPPIVLPEFNGWLEGESRTKNWTIDEDSIDIMALAKAVLEGKVPVNCLAPNTTALRSLAKALKDTFNVPGVTAYEKTGFKQT